MPIDKNYYAILGISDFCEDTAIINKAYKKLAIEKHPDKAPNDPEAKAKFQEINEAYVTLTDLQKKQVYDRELWLDEKKWQGPDKQNDWQKQYLAQLERTPSLPQTPNYGQMAGAVFQQVQQLRETAISAAISSIFSPSGAPHHSISAPHQAAQPQQLVDPISAFLAKLHDAFTKKDSSAITAQYLKGVIMPNINSQPIKDTILNAVRSCKKDTDAPSIPYIEEIWPALKAILQPIEGFSFENCKAFYHLQMYIDRLRKDPNEINKAKIDILEKIQKHITKNPTSSLTNIPLTDTDKKNLDKGASFFVSIHNAFDSSAQTKLLQRLAAPDYGSSHVAEGPLRDNIFQQQNSALIHTR